MIQINDRHGRRVADLVALGGEVGMSAYWSEKDRAGSVTRFVPRADLLAAVRTECDAIVIARADLPEVDPDWDGRGSADAHRSLAYWHLARAAHLDAHPLVAEVTR